MGGVANGAYELVGSRIKGRPGGGRPGQGLIAHSAGGASGTACSVGRVNFPVNT